MPRILVRSVLFLDINLLQHYSSFQGVFVQFVGKNTPASLAGLRFGDQILQIDGQNVAGYSGDKVMEMVKKTKNPQRIVLAVRDRYVWIIVLA